MSRNTNLTPGNYGSFFSLSTLRCKGACFPASVVVKSASVTHQLQLPLLCNTTVMALLVHTSVCLGRARHGRGKLVCAQKCWFGHKESKHQSRWFHAVNVNADMGLHKNAVLREYDRNMFQKTSRVSNKYLKITLMF